MPRAAIKQTFDLTTRNQYTKCQCEVGMTVDGKELPTMALLGEALENAIKMIQDRVTESYKAVPERTGV